MTTTLQRQDGRLTVARLAWLAVALIYGGGSIVTLPLRLSRVPEGFAPSSSGVSDTDFLAGLAQMGVSPDTYFALQKMFALLPLVYIALALFLFWRRSDDWMAIFTSVLFLIFLGPFGEFARVDPRWTIVGDVSDILTTILTFLWFFIFPDGRFVPRGMRWVFALLLVTQVVRIFRPELYGGSFPIVGVIIFGGILVAQVFRYRHAGAGQRQQIKWVVYGIVVGAAPLVLFLTVYSIMLNGATSLGATVLFTFFGGFLWEFFLIALPVSLTLAILRSRLFDIDVIIRRTATYSLVTAGLLLVFFGTIVVLQQLFAALTGARQNELVTVLSTLVIAVLFVPLRNRVQYGIDRRFNRRRYNAQAVLDDFSRTARDETDLGKLTGRLIEVVHETMQPASASVWLAGTRDRGL